jgi:hypothetical protein
MTELFDTAVTSLLHLPEVLDCLAAADGDRRLAGHHAAHGHGHGRIHGLGGGGRAPVDIVVIPSLQRREVGVYSFLVSFFLLSFGWYAFGVGNFWGSIHQ